MRSVREGKSRGRFSEEERAELVAAFVRRECSAQEFANAHAVSVPTLYQWVHRTRSGPGPVGRRLQFQEMAMGSVLGPGWVGEVQLPDGTQLRWNNQAELSGVQRLLCQLRPPC